MPIARKDNNLNTVGTGYLRDPLVPYVQSFLELSQNVMRESSLDIFEEPNKIMRRNTTKNAFKKFFCENFMDTTGADPIFDDIEIADRQKMMEQQFENDVDAINENAVMNSYNPVIGMAFPVHKNILMNMVFDKGAIQKVVAETPKFTISMEKRFLVDTEGNKIDMFTEQNKMTPAIDNSNPVYLIELNLPEQEQTDVLAKCGGTKQDSLSIKTHVAYIKLEKVYVAEGERLPDANGVISNKSEIATAEQAKEYTNVWFPVHIEFKPGYNQFDRTFMQPIAMKVRTSADTVEIVKDTLSGTMDSERFNIFSASGAIKAVKLAAELDTSNAMQDTCHVEWSVDTSLVEIPNAVKINTTISPEEVKDLAALYQVNQLTKVMSLFKTAMANYKDDKILQFLDESYDRLDERAKGYAEFDFAPPEGYALDFVEWRYKTFFDVFDSQVTKMLQVLNDSNVVVTVFGDPDLVRKMTPTTYTYQAPSSIGPVEIDYSRTVVTSDKRIYQFIGSDKLRGSDDLIVILCPRNSDRIIYRIYDYQMYVSNEIRNINNPALPNVNAFDRWLITEYQPVQTRVHILNRTGFRPAVTP